MLIKRLIKRSIFYKYFAKNEVNFANKNTLITLEAFPRSGQTFLRYFLENYTKKISSHTHSVCNLKLSFKYKVKMIIILREPSESISSFINYRKKISNTDYKIENSLDDWLDFYEFIFNNRKSNLILIVNFDNLIKYKEKFYKEILEFSGINSNKIKKNLNLTLKRVNKKKINNKLFSLKHKSERNLEKEQIKKKILKNSRYKKIFKIYTKLLNDKVFNNNRNIKFRTNN